jgi:hypothetical protein
MPEYFGKLMAENGMTPTAPAAPPAPPAGGKRAEKPA